MAFVYCLPAIAAEGRLRPIDLRCEYRENPLGIDTLQPRMSWILGVTYPEARGQVQTAYQILAASSKERLLSDQGDLWDTGKVESSQSIQVSYNGKPLASRSQVWWKVRVWDKAGEPSSWSEPAFWSMGLLKAEDWKAEWIGLDGGEGKPEELREARWLWSSETGPGARYFRRTIEISKDHPVTDVLLFLVASGTATLYVNGTQAGRAKGIKDPISTDITDALHTGTNIVGVAVTSAGNDPPGLIGAFEMEFARGETTIICTDQQWRVSEVEADGWKDARFNDSGWAAAKVVGEYGMVPWGEVGWAERRVLPARMLRNDFR
jgi:alpha-L-rhamnosidase